MPPHRPCSEPGCPRYADPKGRGKCLEHRRAYERERSRVRRADARERNRFYARKHWRMVRKSYLFEHPICEHEDGCERLAEHVHHIVDLADGGDEYDPENLTALCAPHHSRITLARQRGR
jgi:5-methylcytosine-specific restriction endonuclease McrA